MCVCVWTWSHEGLRQAKKAERFGACSQKWQFLFLLASVLGVLVTFTAWHLCKKTQSYVWHDSVIRVPWFCLAWHDSFINVVRLNHVRDMTLSYAWHDSVIWVTWLTCYIDSISWRIHTWHDSFGYHVTHSEVTWLMHMWHDSFVCRVAHLHMTRLIRMRCDSFMCDTTHSYVTWFVHTWHDSFVCDVTHS